MNKISTSDYIRRFALATTVVMLVASMTLGIAKQAFAISAARPQISFTFDDGESSGLTFAAPTLQKYGYTATEYVTTSCIGMTTAPNTCGAEPTATYMTWAQINQLRTTYGWEIGAHTVTHPLLASTSTEQPVKLTPAQVTAELKDSQDAITANTGVKPLAFASPYGDYDPAGTSVLAEVARYYTSHRGFADTGLNGFPYNNYLLTDIPVQGNVPVATVKSYIDQAITSKKWLILTFHHIVASGASTAEENYQYNVADLDAIAAYAQSKGIANTNITNGLVSNPSGGNLVTNSSFDTAISATTTDTTSWSTDAPATIKQDTANNGNAPSSTNSVSITSTGVATHLYSNTVAVAQKPYVVQGYVHTMQIGAVGELGFIIDEFDANGTYLGFQYKAAVLSTPNPLVRMFAFEYAPTVYATGVAVAKARLQVVAVANSALTATIDNVQWFAQDGSTTLVATATGAGGDINGDTKVDVLDLSTALANWNVVNATAAQGDVNGDKVVDVLDLSIILSNWSK